MRQTTGTRRSASEKIVKDIKRKRIADFELKAECEPDLRINAIEIVGFNEGNGQFGLKSAIHATPPWD